MDERFLTAVEINNLPEVFRCLDAGANPNVSDINGYTPLHYAAERGDTILAVKLLACKGIQLQPPNIFGETPLHLACAHRQLRLIKLLLKNNVDPNVRNRLDKTPLHQAARRDSIVMAMLLIRYKAEVNVVDLMERTPLQIALLDRIFLPMGKYLLKHGADPNMDTGQMMPLFLEAVLNCETDTQLSAVLLLIQHGADVNTIDRVTKRNALHLAALTGCAPMVLELLRLGCDSEHVDLLGRRPVDVARAHYNDDAAFVLEHYSVIINLFSIDDIFAGNKRLSMQERATIILRALSLAEE